MEGVFGSLDLAALYPPPLAVGRESICLLRFVRLGQLLWGQSQGLSLAVGTLLPS